MWPLRTHKRPAVRARSGKGKTRRGRAGNAAARSYTRRHRRLALRRAMAVLGLAITLGAGLVVWRMNLATAMFEATLARLEQAAVDAGLAVDSVLVTGRRRTAGEDILNALGAPRGTPIFAFDPRAAKARIEALAWVRAATVRRLLPDTITVNIDEREPFARWQLNGRTRLIDREGVTVADGAVGTFGNLPLVVGEGAPEKAFELMTMLGRGPALNRRVVAAIRVGGRRWRLRLANGVTVELPQRNEAAAWIRLAGLDRDYGLLDRDVLVVDLRLPDRVVARLARGALRGRLSERST